MSRIILQVFAVGLFFAFGHALQCYKCKIGFFDLCYTSKITCQDGEQCFSGNGKAITFVDVKTKGCLAVAECNKTSNVNFPLNSTNTYQMTKTCCSTDLCNSAPGLPGSSALNLAFASITALFVAKILV